MKHLLPTTIAAVALVGCGEPQQSAPQAEPVEPVAEASQPEPPTAKAPVTSIHDAAEDGNIEVVKQHIAAGTDVNAKEEDGSTPLIIAAALDHKEVAELLIDKGADVNAKNKFGRTPLHYAVDDGRKEIVELLIDAGADVNAKADSGTPLHNAASDGHKEIVELLIAAGADVNARDDRGETPLDLAVITKNTEVADLLREHGGESGAADSIHVATAVGNIEAVKQHLAAGTDVNAKGGPVGRTPLHEAVLRGHKEIAELLIANGADVNAKDNFGFMPLVWAIDDETADLLRKHGGKTKKELEAAGK